MCHSRHSATRARPLPSARGAAVASCDSSSWSSCTPAWIGSCGTAWSSAARAAFETAQEQLLKYKKKKAEIKQRMKKLKEMID